MVTAAKKCSQVITHMTIAFAITYATTGSLVLGGLVVLLEPVINVLLLPFHQRLWAWVQDNPLMAKRRMMMVAAEKISQTGLHMAVAFGVMYWATGSAAFGGLAAILEPICNVILLPFHDRAWENFRASLQAGSARRMATL